MFAIPIPAGNKEIWLDLGCGLADRCGQRNGKWMRCDRQGENDNLRGREEELMFTKNPVKALIRWFSADERSIGEQIAQAFAVITVINSFMMAIGWDRPKTGSFAYLHLLSRLGIIAVVAVLWESSDLLVALHNRGRSGNPVSVARDGLTKNIERRFRILSRDRFSLVGVVFTVVLSLFSAGMVILQGVINPAGGMQLYVAIMVLYVALWRASFFLPRQ